MYKNTKEFVGNKYVGLEETMETAIEQTIRNYFPVELIDSESFEDWCRPLRDNANSGALNLFYELEIRLEEVKKECLAADGIHRDYVEIFGGANALIKSISSIRSKLARDLYDESHKLTTIEKWPAPCRICKYLYDESQKLTTIERQTIEQLTQRVYRFSDLGRVRIIADFPSDVAYLQKRLIIRRRFLGSYPCPKGVKDFIFDPKLRDGLKGHRARQFSVRVALDGTTTFGFEVQLMTRLQHAWDRRNHPLYEWQRENIDWQKLPKAVQLAVDDFACAETLHLVDRQAEHNWQYFRKEFLKERQT